MPSTNSPSCPTERKAPPSPAMPPAVRVPIHLIRDTLIPAVSAAAGTSPAARMASPQLVR